MVLAILVLTAVQSSGGAQAGATEDLEARWRREYPGAAAKLERDCPAFLAKGRYSIHVFSGESVTADDLTVASSGESKVFVLDGRTAESPKYPRKPVRSIVRCRTPQYVFVLTKETVSAPYSISGYSEKFEAEGVEFNDDYDMFARSATVYIQHTLLERMQSPSFVVKGVTAVLDGGVELVRIDYTYENERHKESGSVWLNPRQSWAIRKVEIVDQWPQLSPSGEPYVPGNFKREIEYQEVGDKVFLPKRMEHFARTPDPKIYEHVLLQLDQIKVGVPPADVFRLAGYGLPDIPLRPRAEAAAFSLRNPVFWGALATALISFTLLKLLHVRSRDASKATLRGNP